MCDEIKRLCICQICKCGRHRCQNTTCPPPIGPCGSTEYRDCFEAYGQDAGRQATCRPPNALTTSDAPLEKYSTHRWDYRRPPLDELWRHKQIYKPPEGDMDDKTSYSLQFTAKPIEKVTPIRHLPKYVIGEFTGQPSYKVDYKWPRVISRSVPTPAPYVPPEGVFDGTSNYQLAYTGHRDVKPTEIMRPKDTPPGDGPMGSRTTYRDNFQDYEQPPRCADTPRLPPAESSPPLNDLTSYSKEYCGETRSKQKICRPVDSLANVGRSESLSTHRRDYVPWDDVIPYHHSRDNYRPPDNKMNLNTTSRTHFNRKPLVVEKGVTAYVRQNPGQFHSSTTTRGDYKFWKTPVPTRHQPEPYHQSDRAMDTVPTYRDAYVVHGTPPAKSCKPPFPGVVNEPSATKTEYRQEYHFKTPDVCPAARLSMLTALSGRDKMRDVDDFKFENRDTVGHQWFTKRHCS